ncbi:hypothetical protein AGR5A_Cc170398 [Agrobacterium genomosp. 5 str. CFBP 6626]|nr:hypothetical protein AGR5A_Cc170398 [Agrobacterium genomosp. 5 str. CFBP 6626]
MVIGVGWQIVGLERTQGETIGMYGQEDCSVHWYSHSKAEDQGYLGSGTGETSPQFIRSCGCAIG